MKQIKNKLTLYLNSLCDELRSVIAYRKNKPRTPKLKKLCSFVLAFSLLAYTFLGLFGCLKASASDVGSSPSLEASITDLTGYTVTVPSGWSQHNLPSSDTTINITGILNVFDGVTGVSFDSLVLAEHDGDFRISFISSTGSENNVYLKLREFSIQIQGGSDTSNSSFIQWFYDNDAVFTKENRITDLTGYTITVPSGWNVSSGLIESVGVSGKFTSFYGSDIPFSILRLGYASDEGYIYESSDIVSFDNYNIDGLDLTNSSFTISELTGNVTNSQFIQWLYDNNASFTPPPDVPVLLTGDFVFDSNIFPDGIPSMWTQNLNFYTNGEHYTSMSNDSGWLRFGSDVVYKHDSGGWVDDSYRYIYIPSSAVPIWFYQWFNSVTSPYTPLPSSSLEGLYFVSNTAIESSFEITFARPFLSNSKYFNTIYFTNAISGDMISYVDSNNNQIVVYSEGSGWLDPRYSVILFNTSETISGEDYNSFSTYYTSVTNDLNLNLLYNAGLENGRVFGYSEGYDDGCSEGYSDGESSALGNSFMGDFFGGIIDALDALTLFGSISVLDIIQGVLGLFIALWVLKLIAGG